MQWNHVDLAWKTTTRHWQDHTPTTTKGLALCLDATLGIKAHRWVLARTPRYTDASKGKAVGGPQHDPQCDKRAQSKDRHTEIAIGISSRNSECITDWLDSFLMDEIFTYARSGNQVDESKSTRLLRIRLVLEEDASALRSESTIERSTSRISTVHSYRELFGSDGEPIEFEWNVSLDLLHWRSSRRSKMTCKIKTLERFKETNHPVFKSISALNRGILTRKNNRDAIHFNADSSNTEFLFRTIHSANQLSIYGAVQIWCEEFGQRPIEKEPTSERFMAKENEQLLENVKPQEVNSSVKIQGEMIQHSEKDCENVFRTSKHWYKKLRRCVILEKSLYWNVLQNCSRRRWWFWRWNFSMQRVYTPSCWVRFQNFCRNSRTNNNWTRSSSSYYTISWHPWKWNSDSIYDNAKSDFLGSDMPREELLRGGVTSQRSRPQSFLLERSVAKESEPCSTEVEQSNI